ncbi:DUF1345 domain-containing protein [Sphingomonas sp.]|uniref:DUF1345 domain-containing protein n=1 Tax=Sphingomonas sp. TaxID=28214 RepID=UPI00286A7010|nr:DUF1345 domain-containing protein [Sphingomonas sp.]
MAKRKGIGNRFAPMRFLLFLAMLILGVGSSVLVSPWWLGVMYGFDFAALVFVLSCINLFRHKEKEMRLAAEENDANRGVLLIVAFALTSVVLVAVGSQLAMTTKTSLADISLTILTLIMAWVFANAVYSLHYAHLFYTSDDGGKDMAGIEFPGTGKHPEFADFVYFAFTIGCTLAVSDTNVTSPHIRKVVTAHSVAGFIYNVGVFALTVNLLAGRS